MGETLERSGLLKKRVDERTVVLMFFGVGERVNNFFVADEFFCYTGFRIVHGRMVSEGGLDSFCTEE